MLELKQIIPPRKIAHPTASPITPRLVCPSPTENAPIKLANTSFKGNSQSTGTFTPPCFRQPHLAHYFLIESGEISHLVFKQKSELSKNICTVAAYRGGRGGGGGDRPSAFAPHNKLHRVQPTSLCFYSRVFNPLLVH